MPLSLREDSEGVASTVATLFTLVIILLLLQASVVGVVPAKQYEAEHVTSMAALSAFDLLRATASGAAVPNSRFTVTVPIGTPAVSPFAVPSEGVFQLDTEDVSHADISFQYEPSVQHGEVARAFQDVVLMIDSSGSMSTNDPGRLRVSGAKEYISRLQYPDRVAIVDFDSVARLTMANIGQPAHHLFWQGHDGVPDYSEPQTDVDTIDQAGGTNYGAAIQVANDELINYGDPAHAWIEILLTDGVNNFPWQDVLALSEANRAKANGITIYTIGLGPAVDPTLLTQIAQITGGTYYGAPDANSIRWIYFEISMRYAGFFSCGTLSAVNSISGSISLNLGNRRYPSQTMRLEAGGVTIAQQDGSFVHQGIPFSFDSSGKGTGSLQLTLLTLTAPAFRATGTEYRFVTAQFIQRSLQDQIIDRPSLAAASTNATEISAYVQFWANNGGATPAGAAAVRDPINKAAAVLSWGQVNMTAGKPTQAKFNVDSASAQFSTAIITIDNQVATGNMQNGLALSVKGQLLQAGCRLDQWRNWFSGITLTIHSPAPTAWAVWFNRTFGSIGVPISHGVVGNQAILTINAIDRFVIDERVIALSFD